MSSITVTKMKANAARPGVRRCLVAGGWLFSVLLHSSTPKRLPAAQRQRLRRHRAAQRITAWFKAG